MIIETTYKRFLLICGMLCVLLIAFAEEIVIGSWNIQGHGRRGRFGEQDAIRVIQFASYFVRNKRIDVLALQEVNLKVQIGNNNILEEFIQVLSKQTGSRWAYISSAEYALRRNSADKKYTACLHGLDNAVLYRSDKVIVEDLHSGHPFYFDNFEKSKYKMNMNHTNILKISSINGQSSIQNYFYFINTHMPATDKDKRERDIGVLHQIYTVLDNNIPIILCGDFNLNHNELQKVFSDCFVECREGTTISPIQYVNNYDHFILNAAAKKLEGIQKAIRYTSRVINIFTGQIHYGNKVTTLEDFLHISDHVPIFMSIDIGNF